MKQPELLAPAGNYEKAMIAFRYGADAVYVGGTVFGLRKYADNVSNNELQKLIAYANKNQKAVYVVLNAFAHNSDIEPIKAYLTVLESIQPHALIISDIAVIHLAKQLTSIPIHVSTQASATNHYACEYYKALGATRVILAREVSIEDCKAIKNHCDIELEIFVHGAMCASYSGKCVISNYSAGRDSNRGGCVQSCRHNYQLIDPKTGAIQQQAHIMNAKDLMGLYQLPEIIHAGIESVKIEGRMKSNLYVANAVSCYRKALDYCYNQQLTNQPIDTTILETLAQQLENVSNRSFSHGGLIERPHGSSLNTSFSHYLKNVHFLGTVHGSDAQGNAICLIKSDFTPDDQLMLLSPSKPFEPLSFTHFSDMLNQPIDKAKPNSVIKLKSEHTIEPYSLLVKTI